MDPAPPPETGSPPAAAPRKRLRWSTLFFAAIWIYLAVKLAPHAAATLGIDTGAGLMPSYRYTTIDGPAVGSADLAGKVVLVNFWATWCLPCRAEMPLLQAMADRHRDRGFVVYGLSVDRGAPETVRAFLEQRGISYPVAIVGRDAEQAFGGIVGYPTSLLLDRHGRVRHRAVGPLVGISFELAVRRLLAEPANSAKTVDRSSPVP